MMYVVKHRVRKARKTLNQEKWRKSGIGISDIKSMCTGYFKTSLREMNEERSGFWWDRKIRMLRWGRGVAFWDEDDTCTYSWVAWRLSLWHFQQPSILCKYKAMTRQIQHQKQITSTALGRVPSICEHSSTFSIKSKQWKRLSKS